MKLMAEPDSEWEAVVAPGDPGSTPNTPIGPTTPEGGFSAPERVTFGEKMRERVRVLAQQVAQDALADVLDIRGALAEVLVLGLGERPQMAPDDVVEDRLDVEEVGLEALDDLLPQRLVLEDELRFDYVVLTQLWPLTVDEIVASGAGASTFADSWAYKLEAWDAIPFNAALMAERGVRVTINSDSDERARRLYQEAAKAIKYGGASEEEALKMITLNAAWQLGIDGQVGSIDVGKDADLAIFNAHPFSPAARVEMTLIDGRKFFDRQTAPTLEKLMAQLKLRGRPATDGGAQ